MTHEPPIDPTAPFRSAVIAVRRSGGWGFPRLTLLVDGRRRGYLGRGTVKAVRLPAGEHGVSVRFGRRRVDYGPFRVGPGERVELVCGWDWNLPDEMAARGRAVAFVFGRFLTGVAAALVMPATRGALMLGWANLPVTAGDWLVYRAIEIFTSPAGAFVAGLLLWPLLARPLARAVRDDAGRRRYLGPEPFPAARPAGKPVPSLDL